MLKKILLSAKKQDDIIDLILDKLLNIEDFEFIFHDPTLEHLDLENLSEFFKNIDFIIVKVAGECSFDILHYAKLYNIPTLHDIDAVLMCKNKVALDQAMRKTLNKHSQDLKSFKLPKSWTNSVNNEHKFKEWAKDKLPIVLKSHYQHEKYNRFNFLVRDLKEVDIFRERYKQFLYYDVYIQEFIECDAIDRKIYVIGDKIFGIQRENPIYIFMRENPEDIDVSTIKRENLKITDEIRKLAKILSTELNLKIFGFDLLKPLSQEGYYLIDLNDFPGFRGIEHVEDAFIDFITKYLKEFFS